jgi:Tol biopolymer transport system component
MAWLSVFAQILRGTSAMTRQRSFGVFCRIESMMRSSAEPEIGRPELNRSDSLADRLDSWKEIAAFLGRGVRTVQRWERSEGLPVHRLVHEKRGTVYALRHEVSAWWESRRESLPAAQSQDTGDALEPPKLQRVTRMSAATQWPALSSDGRMAAYVSDHGQDGTTPQIWLQQIGGASTRLTTGLRALRDLSFAPGDTWILFTAQGDAGQNLYEIPTLGGEPRMLRRGARGGRISPDGRWLSYVSLDSPAQLRIVALDEPGVHRVVPRLIDVAFAVWSEASTRLVAQAHDDPTFERDFWIVPVDGGHPVNTGIMQRLRQRGLFLLLPDSPHALIRDSLIFSVISGEGIHLWRQRLTPVTFQPQGEPERLTVGTDLDAFPTGASGRLAFVRAHPDQNLWSVALDASSGVATAAPRRMTRGPGIVAHLSSTSNGRTLSYFAVRSSTEELRLRDLATDAERLVAEDFGSLSRGFPVISPNGGQLAFAVRSTGPKTVRPIFVTNLSDETTRSLGDDCGGRPRQWLDERRLLIESFGSRLNKFKFAILDTVDGSRCELVGSADQLVSNPRVSLDGRWIAFDATRLGSPPRVIVAALGDANSPIADSDWKVVAVGASHPFWSADGRLIFYLPTTPTIEHRNAVRARRFDAASGLCDGDSFEVFTSNEMVIPALVTGTAPLATRDQIFLVLGDYRGDVWLMELERS